MSDVKAGSCNLTAHRARDVAVSWLFISTHGRVPVLGTWLRLGAEIGLGTHRGSVSGPSEARS